MASKLFVTDCVDNQKFSYLLAVIGDADAVLFRAPQVVAIIPVYYSDNSQQSIVCSKSKLKFVPAEIWLVLRRWTYPFWM